MKGGHVRRASGPCGTRRSAHVPHKRFDDLPLSSACFLDEAVNERNAVLRRSPIGADHWGAAIARHT